MVANLDDRKSLSIAFLAISGQYTTFFYLFSQNGCRRPFWMTESHFPPRFSPFQINTQLFFSQNGCRRPFWMTENHFWSHFSPFQINRQLLFIFIIFTKWLPVAILDERKSLSIAFLAISEQYATFFLIFFQNGVGGHFGSPICAKTIVFNPSLIQDKWSHSKPSNYVLPVQHMYTTNVPW